MRGLKGLSKLVVVAMTAATLALMAAVGASAGAGKFGSEKAIASVVALVPGQSNVTAAAPRTTTTNAPSMIGEDNGKHLDKEKGLCHPPKKHHKHGTPGHKHHPCGDEDNDSD